MQNQAVLEVPQPEICLWASRGGVHDFPQAPVDASSSLLLSIVGLYADKNHVILK